MAKSIDEIYGTDIAEPCPYCASTIRSYRVTDGNDKIACVGAGCIACKRPLSLFSFDLSKELTAENIRKSETIHLELTKEKIKKDLEKILGK